MKLDPVTIKIKSGTKPLWCKYIDKLDPTNPEKYLTFSEWVYFKVNQSLQTLENDEMLQKETFVDLVDKTVTVITNDDKTTNEPKEQKIVNIQDVFDDDF